MLVIGFILGGILNYRNYLTKYIQFDVTLLVTWNYNHLMLSLDYKIQLLYQDIYDLYGNIVSDPTNLDDAWINRFKLTPLRQSKKFPLAELI
ncbi:hypothetical protein ACFSNA_19675 [Pedobacter mendelii]|uniref:hypothetical protein n=1 Tax=Pedobacter mendelii TaxID=1908240 RepID=UPI00362A6D6E